ncbi:MAG: DUF5034 domain-containing protein [Bacteroidales bacterium]|nr:DUF5034 domain-containing protein [Bacteroidales bacterium]MBN2748396.1 DUF5034 domain-containing protein [Bacteroidales bacterium]
MKTLRAIYTLAASVLIGFTLSGCNGPGADCFPEKYYYSVDGLILYNMAYSPDHWRIYTDSSIHKDSYGIALHTDIMPLNEPYPQKQASLQSFGQKDECMPILYPKDSIVSLRIVTETAFSSTLPAGSEVTTLFKVEDNWIQANEYEYIAIPEYLNRPAPIVGDYRGPIIRCRLMEAPQNAGEYSFSVTLILSDGREITQKISATLTEPE